MICPYCEHAESVIKRGFRKLGRGERVQKYWCKTCERWFTERTGTVMNNMQMPEADAAAILKLRQEGMGVRATARLVGHSHWAVIALERRVAKLTGVLLLSFASLAGAVTPVFVCDEVYTRVHHNCPAAESPGWTATGVERNSRAWVPFVTGPRNDALFEGFARDAFPVMLTSPTAAIVSDGETRYASGAAQLVAQPRMGRSAGGRAGPSRGHAQDLAQGLASRAQGQRSSTCGASVADRTAGPAAPGDRPAT